MSQLLIKGKSRIEKLRHERKYLFKKLESFQNPDRNEGDLDSISVSDLSVLSDEEIVKKHDVVGSAAMSRSNSIAPISAPAPKFTTTKRKPKDPNAPKRRANAFMIFCDLERDAIKRERDEMKANMPGSEEDAGLGNITKALGARWSTMPEDKKAHYNQLFQEEVKTFNIAMAEYKKGLEGSVPVTNPIAIDQPVVVKKQVAVEEKDELMDEISDF